MPNVTFVLDGDPTRRLIKRKLGKNPTPAQIEAFCISTKKADESIVEGYYYDCAPFGEKRPLPISGTEKDFSGDLVYTIANLFQGRMVKNPFFKFKKGYLSFDGWTIKEEIIKELIIKPRALTDKERDPF